MKLLSRYIKNIPSLTSIRIIERENPSKVITIFLPVIAILLAIFIGSVVPLIIGISPVHVFFKLIEGIFFSRARFYEILVTFIPLSLTGLSVAMAFKANFFNIGAEGQFLVGAITSFGIATLFSGLNSYLMIPIVLLAGFIGGGIWGAIPGILKVYTRTNEVVTTLLMNYIALNVLKYLVHGPWQQKGFIYPWSWEIPDTAVLPRMLGSRVHLGLIFSLICTIIIYILIKKTYFGYEIKIIGENSDTAKSCGINIKKNIILLMIISGGLAGIAGMSQLTGLQFRLNEQIAGGFGYLGITAALIGKLNPIGTILGALILSAIFVGGQHLQRILEMPFSYVDIIAALVVIFILVSQFLSRNKISISE